jgi:hypothetical protein
MSSTRRRFLRNAAVIAGATSAARHVAMAAVDELAPFRTPYKYPRLILSATGRKGDFDQRSIDDPIVFFANGAFQMLYIGWDGIGLPDRPRHLHRSPPLDAHRSRGAT